MRKFTGDGADAAAQTGQQADQHHHPKVEEELEDLDDGDQGEPDEEAEGAADVGNQRDLLWQWQWGGVSLVSSAL